VAYQVVLSRLAERDLLRIQNYIAQQAPDAAAPFTSRLLAQTKTLAIFPNGGSHLPSRPGLRFLPIDRYLIIYRVVESKKEIRILSFRHSARAQHQFRGELGVS
jgi:addiction module RelE/StbE family toxin